MSDKKSQTDKFNKYAFEVYPKYNLKFSNRFKRRMNRMFRERVGGDYALHPEVDNIYERMRSKIIRSWLLFKNSCQNKNK